MDPIGINPYFLITCRYRYISIFQFTVIDQQPKIIITITITGKNNA